MKISTNWLREWVPVEAATDALAERLTMAGLEVEGIAPAAPEFSGVVVAEIIACERHPDADKLQVCTVSSGAETLQIVCGAPNARIGLKAPLATIGAVLPGDFKIRRSKLRGVESHGMLCSAKELGLSEDASGLMELPAAAPVGVDLRDWLQLDDSVIEVDLTPNRGDCLSMRGVAREVAALFDLPFQERPSVEVEASIDDRPEIRVEAGKACPRYLGRIVRGIDAGAQSPVWIQERLRRAGLRSLSAVVDVNNYVMLELGQPLHAFDLKRIEGGLVVRMAQNGETLELLNGQTVTLRDDTLVIADHSRPQALAGIMGGEDSAVADDSVDILLESAFFAPGELAGRARQYGLHTDSSHRLERGVDPQLTRRAMERATELILQIAGGSAGPVVEVAEQSALPTAPEIHLREARIGHVLGIEIPSTDVEAILQRLGLQVEAVADGWRVGIPSFRFDLAIEVDLIEELARVWGYDRIPAHRPAQPVLMSPQPESRITQRRLRELLVDRAYQEAITYSFIEPRMQRLFDPEQTPLALANPLSSELSVMRTSLWPGLINAVLYNQNRQQTQLRLFEIGLRFRGELGSLAQERMLAGVASGARLSEQWGAVDVPVDFYDVKGDVEALLELSGPLSRFEFRAAAHPALHPGQSAQIWRGEQLVGWIGALHPQLEKDLDLDGRTFVFELLLDAITAAQTPAFSALSRYPSIRRDLAILVAEAVDAGAVLNCARTAAGDLLRDAFVFDVYRGKGIPEGQKSLAMGLILQDSSRTLVDQDVDEVIDRTVTRLEQEFGAVLRE
jgi:phenylalanyl-tRNA synthetase beta chain